MPSTPPVEDASLPARAARMARTALRPTGGRLGAALVAATVAVIAGGCATAGPELPAAPAPEQIPALERQVAADPDDPVLRRQLGAAHRAAGNPGEAVEQLERSAELGPDEPTTRFFLALAYEDLDRFGEAVEAYRAFQARSETASLDRTVEGRIRILRREQLRRAVRQALEREEELAAQPPDGASVAVFPFLFTGGDSSLQPLSRALAAMLTTDLSRTDRLRVLERLNIQALMDEMELAESGLVDPGTAARSGYILGAGTIVQGRIEGDLDRLALDASVVDVQDPATGDSRPVSLADETEDLFAMEKELALRIYEEVGISLTAAEREAVLERPTENLQAILAYGLGLGAEAEGDYAEAAEHFRRAAELDPGFEQAREDAENAEAMAGAAGASTDELALLGTDVPLPSLDPVIPDFALPSDFDGRDPGAELIGTERPTTAGPAILIIRPGGGGDR